MHVERIDAIQVHPIPKHQVAARGPFPPELFREPEIVTQYESAYNENGDSYEKGATTQNNFTPPRWLRCGECLARVKDTETELHVCE